MPTPASKLRSHLAFAAVVALASTPTLADQTGPSGRTMVEARLPEQQPAPASRESAAPSAAARAGVITEMTPEDRVRAMTSQSTEGLKTVRRPDGAVGIDLEGRFMHLMVAKQAQDGSLVLMCATGDEAAEHAHHAADIAAGRAPKVTPLVKQPVPTRAPNVREPAAPAALEEK